MRWRTPAPTGNLLMRWWVFFLALSLCFFAQTERMECVNCRSAARNVVSIRRSLPPAGDGHVARARSPPHCTRNELKTHREQPRMEAALMWLIHAIPHTKQLKNMGPDLILDLLYSTIGGGRWTGAGRDGRKRSEKVQPAAHVLFAPFWKQSVTGREILIPFGFDTFAAPSFGCVHCCCCCAVACAAPPFTAFGSKFKKLFHVNLICIPMRWWSLQRGPGQRRGRHARLSSKKYWRSKRFLLGNDNVLKIVSQATGERSKSASQIPWGFPASLVDTF